jgi:seryl-tRNA synthetase
VPDPINLAYQVPLDLRWDREIIKVFLESAPYHLNGLIPAVSERSISVSGVPSVPLGRPVHDILTDILSNLVRGYRDVTEQPLGEHKSSRAYAVVDPFATLLEQGALRPSSPGVFGYSGAFLDRMSALDALIADFARSLGAVEEVYPSTVPTAFLARAGYLKSFPHHAMFVAPARYRQESIEAAQSLALRKRDHAEEFPAHLAAPSLTLAPTVCHHTFNARTDSHLPENVTITAANLCHRFEGENVISLERLMTFRMREIIFFGSADHVRKMISLCFEWFQNLLIKWDVSFRSTTATDPFFGNSSDSKRLFQTMGGLKREVKLYIPATGNWIAVASFNNHSESLVNAFEIRSHGPQGLHSGCVGFGLERLLYGLFYAFGTKVEEWPEA